VLFRIRLRTSLLAGAILVGAFGCTSTPDWFPSCVDPDHPCVDDASAEAASDASSDASADAVIEAAAADSGTTD